MLPLKSGSAWDAAAVEAFLDESRLPIRIACHGRGGFPLLCSVWFLWQEGALWCAMQQDALVARRLAADPRCAFEVATNTPPYKGVRGQARAHAVKARGAEVLETLLHRYLGGTESDLARWLLDRAASEVAIRLEPTWISSWDYSDRMQDL